MQKDTSSLFEAFATLKVFNNILLDSKPVSVHVQHTATTTFHFPCARQYST